MLHNRSPSLFLRTSTIALVCLSLTGCIEEETFSKKKAEPVNRLNVKPKISEFLHSFVPQSPPIIEMPSVKAEPEVSEDIEDVPQYGEHPKLRGGI